jgi:hypothetical protein
MPTMICLTDALAKPRWRWRRGTITIELRSAAGLGLGALAATPLSAVTWSLIADPRAAALPLTMGALAGWVIAVAQPSGESLAGYVVRALRARRSVVEYRGRKGRLYVGLCPVPVDEIARGDRVLLRSSAVEVHPDRVGSRGEILAGEGT